MRGKGYNFLNKYFMGGGHLLDVKREYALYVRFLVWRILWMKKIIILSPVIVSGNILGKETI